ncbi:hypothetical protein [Acuticoccus sp. I52.16.1]|uniref:hypothetical protein n=1 Tax=Acuticoccus sp. I52.16.1 TaxID=2928472 RepID=UPI001FD0FA36|nr:hypothetical protein [Acuticoccus sp. I52.16.1]UOM34966.1 hypothetical protein MRB58_01765 [Acuticoccus sp. I52.16.1]
MNRARCPMGGPLPGGAAEARGVPPSRSLHLADGQPFRQMSAEGADLRPNGSIEAGSGHDGVERPSSPCSLFELRVAPGERSTPPWPSVVRRG